MSIELTEGGTAAAGVSMALVGSSSMKARTSTYDEKLLTELTEGLLCKDGAGIRVDLRDWPLEDRIGRCANGGEKVASFKLDLEAAEQRSAVTMMLST